MSDDAMWTPPSSPMLRYTVRTPWEVSLGRCIHDAAVEEMRVRLAVKRFAREYRHELSAARRHVPIGGRR